MVAEGKHRQADDTPYGGGAGMVMRVDVVDRGIRAVAGSSAKVLLMIRLGVRSPKLTLASRERSSWSWCAGTTRASTRASRSISWMRWCPLETLSSPGRTPRDGGHRCSGKTCPVCWERRGSQTESFSDGLLEAPQYARPRVCGLGVPEVLLSGHHARIEAWREAESRALTAANRPDLVESLDGSADSVD